MKTLKRFKISLALPITATIFLTSSLLAQQRQGQGPPPIPNEAQIIKMVEDVSTELSLNDGQKTEILPLYIEHFEEAKSLMNSGQRPSREEMESLRAEFEEEVENLLNDKQQEKFEEFLKNHESQSKNRQNKHDRK